MSADDRGSRRSVFDALHRTDEDPWDFATSPYEIAKRAATMAALPDRTFDRSLEIGCSTGYLSEAIARKSRQVLALDVSAVAVARARSRVGDGAPIRFRQAEIPREWPPGRFDLIVFSEVLYFMDAEEIASCARLARGALAPDGLCLLVNWTGPNDLDLSGLQAAGLFLEAADWTTVKAQREEFYSLQLLRPMR